MSKYRRITFDIESNGLLEDSDKIWCLSAKDVDTEEIATLSDSLLTSENIEAIFYGANEVIGHNIISYDIPMIKKFFGIDLIDFVGKRAIVDTYLMSKVLNPDREMPKGCPTSIRCEETGRVKRIGPHGLESWGYRVGVRKIEIHDWMTFTPSILERCEVDVDINIKVYHALLKEANLKCWRE